MHRFLTCLLVVLLIAVADAEAGRYESHKAQFAKGPHMTAVGATFFCSVSVSAFLQRYAPEDLAPAAAHAYPHDLVHDLLERHPPRRMIVFSPDRTANIYEPRNPSGE